MLQEEKEKIKNDVLREIEAGRIKMIPRWHFVLRGLLLVVCTIVVLLLFVYVASFVFFVSRQNGIFGAAGFGGRGMVTFLRNLPWLLVGISVLFFAVLGIFLRKYSFTGRKPLIYSGLVVLLFVTAISFVAEPLHREFFRLSEQGRPPIPGAGGFYRSFGMPNFDDIHPGVFVTSSPEGFIFVDPRDGSTSTVVISSDTEIFPNFPLVPGEHVVVFGDINNRRINAYGVRR